MRRRGIATVGLLVLALLLSAGCAATFFRPEKGLYVPPGLARVDHEDIFFTTDDGVRLHGWRLSPKRAGVPRGALLFLHGNAGNVGVNVAPAVWLAEAGFVVFTFDYRGYGLSAGEPTFPGIQADARAALALLAGLPGVDPGRIALLGQSLGGSVAIYLAATAPERTRVKAVVADSAFADYRLIVRDRMKEFPLTWLTRYPVSLLFDDRYSPERVIDRISPVPILLIHGTDDRVVPIRHAEILFGKAREPKRLLVLRGGEHAEGLSDGQSRARVLDFLDEAFRRAE